MANYELHRLNNNEFEHLVQALSTKIFNFGNIIFGAGRDGAREATFEGTFEIPEEGSNNGYCVVQAKFKECTTTQDKQNWKWARDEFKKEMEKFLDQKRGLRTPEIYFFFTNIQFTAVHESGGRDEIEKFIKNYNHLIPKIKIYGHDEINTFLDNNRDVATSYASFILPGDILQYLYQSIQANNKKDQHILYRFLSHEFEEDLYSKLEQANELTDQKINLEKVFVDLDITNDDFGNNGVKFVDHCIKVGNNVLKDNQYKMVFIGGPGQGKSTVTQFLTQIYRAYFLKNSSFTVSNSVHNFLENIPNNHQPMCYRFPVRVILSDYSEWINLQKKKNESSSVLSYIQYRIEYRADAQFSEFGHFRTFLEQLSFLFIFDGLDEVPSTSNRNDVMNSIYNFIHHELHSINCDALIIATTRPQGYSNEFNPIDFKHFVLDNLDNSTCMEYLIKLVYSTVNSNDERQHQLKILEEALENEITSEIMRTPLQATIMSILVKSGGKPSKDKFSLFNDYYQTMLKREKQKNVLKIISEHDDYINGIHYRLGNKLQLSSQEQENSSALMDIAGFRDLVDQYFTEQELDEDKKTKYIAEIMMAITTRLVFITENQEKKIGFAIRSTQEYFSAMQNVHNKSDPEVITNIKTISESIYWRNVFIFMLGYIAKNKDYLLDNLDSYLSELNGSTLDFQEYSSSKITKYGSLLALEILSESLLINWPRQENKFIKHLQGLIDVIAPNDISHSLNKLKENIIQKGLEKILLDSVKNENLHRRISSWKIISEISRNDEKYLEKFYNFWPKDTKEEVYCITLFLKNDIFHTFILEKSCKYINWDDYKQLLSQKYDEYDFLKSLIESNLLSFHQTAKKFLIEYLFVQIHNRAYYVSNLSNLFFKLLDINSDMEYQKVFKENTFLCDMAPFKASISNMQNFQQNDLILAMYDSITRIDTLSLVFKFLKYLLDPSANTLFELYNAIKEKMNRYDVQLLFQTVQVNWQINYIIFNLLRNSSKDKIETTMRSWGTTFEDFLEYQKTLNDISLLSSHIDYLVLKYEFDNSEHNLYSQSFYDKYYLHNKNALSGKLVISFIWDYRRSNIEIKDTENQKTAIEEIIKIIKTDNIVLARLKFMSSIVIFSLLSPIEILKYETSFIVTNYKFSIHLFNEYTILKAINNIINLVNFKQQESNLIEFIFNLIINEKKYNNDQECPDYAILYNLTYKNIQLKTYGYLLSLLHIKINNNEEIINKITSHLLDASQQDNNVFIDTLSIIDLCKTKNHLLENLLIQMYKNLKKDTVEDCIVVSKYENVFKNIFENKIIKL